MKKDTGRYTVATNEVYEPGSGGNVLKNFLGIKSKNEIEAIEGQELNRVENELVAIFDKDHQFVAADICDIHKKWLGKIYPSAGKYRTVTMSKDDFPFAAPSQIEKLMQKHEKDVLSKYTPCHFENKSELAMALGIVHVELVVIHPFREGNGRTARLLSDLMTMQSDRAPLNYSPIDLTKNEGGFNAYILAIHAGFNGDYKPIQKIFSELLKLQN